MYQKKRTFVNGKMIGAPIKIKHQDGQQSKTLSITKYNPVPYLSVHLFSAYLYSTGS